ncbi:ankyrin repeat domain-containing protein [Polaromonas sp.]|jgi:ankyrin repeat protein|uniref:ankyrin repeat domain-containing protein n=1 Tax=Polaromonas sp. TaxID=1869339 RepID=UPI001DF6083A|nr:ankyrin repeat domain-containing protein [Polaromonas sp.]MBT9476010.1 ankyrin repeat domain-containing protein [Polaromonas sp.]
MKKDLISHLKKLVYLFVFVGCGVVHAGSYEDFFDAIKQDNPAKLQALLARGFDANTPDPKGQHGLYLALTEPSLKAAQVLINWPKTDVNRLNLKGESPLMLAALKGQQDLAAQLIKRGADVNKTGWTALHYAASSAQLAIISLLIEHSAYIDAESPNGTTPLMMAAMYGSPEAVKLLLQEGADPQLKNQQGLTALQFAQRANRPDSAEAIATFIRSKRPAGQW